MPIITGIELRPDSCVLARVRPAAGATEISALHLIERAAWPAHASGVTEGLRELRRRKGFRRTAAVVLWGLDEPAKPNDPQVRPVIKPLIDAGFRIRAVYTPPQALAALSQTRPRTNGAAVAWLALNTHGAAIAIVRDGELLFSRTFDWSYATQVASPHGELLQRYSLVSHLAPELHWAVAAVRNTYGAVVETAVTCGDLPDLRSLTMPLIEELDLEVETLDSTDGLISTGGARTDRFAESAPMLRLAVGAAIAYTTPRRKSMVRVLARAAAAAAIVATAGFLGYRAWTVWIAPPVPTQVASNITAPRPRPTGAPQRRSQSPVSTVTQPPAQKTPSSVTPPPPVTTPPPAQQTKPVVSPPPPVQQSKPIVSTPPPPAQQSKPIVSTPPPPAQQTKPIVSTPPPAQQSKPIVSTPPPPAQQSKPIVSTPPPPAQQTKPIVSPPPPPAQQNKPIVSTPPPPTQQTKPIVATPPPTQQTKPIVQIPPAPRPQQDTPIVQQRPVQREKPVVPPLPAMTETPVAAPPPPPRRVTPLRDALPTVESILISRDRRIAVVNGAIVSIGDLVGPRTVVQIERAAVVFREPSGYEIRVPLHLGARAE